MKVGEIVHYYNPAYEPGANGDIGTGPYAAIVSKIYEPFVSLAVITPGKPALFHVHQVPPRGSEWDDGVYPAWEPAP